MKNLRDTFLLNRYFFLGFALFMTGGSFYLILASRTGSFLYLNEHHNSLLDFFFINYTNLGDGIFSLILVGLFLLLRRFNFAWQILAAYIISGLVSQLLKHLINSPRPRAFFQAGNHIHIIDNITATGNSSFPSGHATSAFALATILALLSNDKKLSCLYLFAAILVAYSRIYLSQHFLDDVLAGAVIGLFVAIVVYSFFKSGGPDQNKKDRLIEEDAVLAG